MDNDVLGLVAAILTTLSFIPQVYRCYKTKSAGDISLFMYLLFSLGVLLWLIYGIRISNMPILVANIFTLTFTVIILYYKIRYSSRQRE